MDKQDSVWKQEPVKNWSDEVDDIPVENMKSFINVKGNKDKEEHQISYDKFEEKVNLLRTSFASKYFIKYPDIKFKEGETMQEYFDEKFNYLYENLKKLDDEDKTSLILKTNAKSEFYLRSIYHILLNFEIFSDRNETILLKQLYFFSIQLYQLNRYNKESIFNNHINKESVFRNEIQFFYKEKNISPILFSSKAKNYTNLNFPRVDFGVIDNTIKSNVEKVVSLLNSDGNIDLIKKNKKKLSELQEILSSLVIILIINNFERLNFSYHKSNRNNRKDNKMNSISLNSDGNRKDKH